jgi:acylphosphatase
LNSHDRRRKRDPGRSRQDFRARPGGGLPRLDGAGGAARLAGWVRNLPDGEVEAVFCGAPDVVTAMLAACREGPRYAEVGQVRVVEEPAAAVAGPFEKF